MDPKNESETIDVAAIHARKERQASGDAIVIANAIHDLADAIREHARAMRGEDTEVDDGQFDLAGERIA